MADPFEHVAPGSPLAIRADTWNALLAGARNDRRRRAGAPGGGAPPARLAPSVTCLVRNDTGGTLSYPGVLALGASVLDFAAAPHDVQGRPLFEGSAPAAATDAFALMTEPLADGKIGVGVVSGVAVCEVAVGDTAHEYAGPVAGDTFRLASATSGPARILDIEAGTGNKKAVVLIGQGGSSSSDYGWLVSLRDSNCLALSVVPAVGECSGIDATQALTLAWNVGEAKWETGDDSVDTPEDDFVHDLGLGPVKFWLADGRARCTIDGVEGVMSAIGAGFAEFTFGGESLCGGTYTPCADNSFTIRLTCQCCAVEGYAGAGWYRILAVGGGSCGTPEDTDCVYFANECEAHGYTICGGPYDTAGDCFDDGSAPAGWTGDMCGTTRDWPGRLYATISAQTAGCACLAPVTFPIDKTTFGGTGMYIGHFVGCDGMLHYLLWEADSASCHATIRSAVDGDPGHVETDNPARTTVGTSPYLATTTFATTLAGESGLCSGGGGLTVTVSEDSP